MVRRVERSPGLAREGYRAVLTRKAAALRAHATQVSVHEPYFALSNDLGQLIAPVEYYRLAGGTHPRPDGEPLADLFAGLPNPR